MRYILNSAVITAPGRYVYRLVSINDAVEWALAGAYRSAVGYEQTADALTEILAQPVTVDRSMIIMEVGDEALVFRLVFPAGTPRIEPGDKGRLWQAILQGHYELGLMTREA